jgi:hypothetical protein
LPVCTQDNQPIPAQLLRPACHESDHRASTATNRCSFSVQKTENIVWSIWRIKEHWYRVLVIDERTSGDWPILLCAAVRSKICHRAAREKRAG